MANENGKIEWTPGKLLDEIHAIVNDELLLEGRKAVEDIRNSFSRGTSTPGKPPGIKSGKLSRGLQFQVIRGQRKLLIGVDPSVTYALALEMGAPAKGLRARPYLRPQRMRSRVRVLERLNKRFNK